MASDELPPAPRPLSTLSSLVGQSDSHSTIRLKRIGGYEVLAVLGQGGMGVVYKARQISLSRIVALKMLLAGPHASPQELARFREEARTLALLSHPHIVQIYDVGEHDGRTYCALEFVEGGNLAERLRAGRLPIRQAAEMSAILAEAVQVIHECGIIHRDLKPSNVLMTRDGKPKITDFGLVRSLEATERQTRSGELLGTPCYMAPEQVHGKASQISPATDVHALGAILYEMLTGQPPFLAETVWETVQRTATVAATPPRSLRPEIPAELERICLSCLAKDARDRYRSAKALANDLRDFLAKGNGPEPLPVRVHATYARWAAVLAITVLAVTLPIVFRNNLNQFFSVDSPNRAEHMAAVERNSEGKGETAATTKDQPAGIHGPDSLAAQAAGRPLTWQALPTIATGEAFDRIAFPTRETGFAAGRRSVYRTEDGGQSWQQLWTHEAGRVSVLMFEDPQTGWLATDRLFSTVDRGETWTEAAFSSLPPLAIRALARMAWGAQLLGGSNAKGKLALYRKSELQGSSASATSAWVELELASVDGRPLTQYSDWLVAQIAPLGDSQVAVVVFSGTDDGGAVLVSDRDLLKWKTVLQSEHDLYSLAMANGRGWLTGNGATFWTTGDNGQTWTAAPYPAHEPIAVTRMVVDPTGNLGLAPLWKGQVLLLDRGRPWREELPPGLDQYSLPDVAVVDATCGYVLGAEGAVARYAVP